MNEKLHKVQARIGTASFIFDNETAARLCEYQNCGCPDPKILQELDVTTLLRAFHSMDGGDSSLGLFLARCAQKVLPIFEKNTGDERVLAAFDRVMRYYKQSDCDIVSLIDAWLDAWNAKWDYQAQTMLFEKTMTAAQRIVRLQGAGICAENAFGTIEQSIGHYKTAAHYNRASWFASESVAWAATFVTKKLVRRNSSWRAMVWDRLAMPINEDMLLSGFLMTRRIAPWTSADSSGAAALLAWEENRQAPPGFKPSSVAFFIDIAVNALQEARALNAVLSWEAQKSNGFKNDQEKEKLPQAENSCPPEQSIIDACLAKIKEISFQKIQKEYPQISNYIVDKVIYGISNDKLRSEIQLLIQNIEREAIKDTFRQDLIDLCFLQGEFDDLL